MDTFYRYYYDTFIYLRFLSGFGFTAKSGAAAVVAVWNVETPRLVRVSKLRGTDKNSSVKTPP